MLGLSQFETSRKMYSVTHLDLERKDLSSRTERLRTELFQTMGVDRII